MEDTMSFLDSGENRVYVETGQRENLVIATPHHIPPKITQNNQVRPMDLNVGYITFYLATILNASYVIETNSYCDPNKDKEERYYKAITSFNPLFVVEIHGHRDTSGNYDVEISSGYVEREDQSIYIANTLMEKMKDDEDLILQELSISGEFHHIWFTATGSITIRTKEWIAIHIELPYKLRKDAHKRPPDKSYHFCDYLKEPIEFIYNNALEGII